MTTSTQELVSELKIIKTALGYVVDYLGMATDTPEKRADYLSCQEENRTLAYLAFQHLHRLIEDNR